MSKDLRGAGGQMEPVLTMPESYAKQVSFRSSFESSERRTIDNVRRQRIPNSRSWAAALDQQWVLVVGLQKSTLMHTYLHYFPLLLSRSHVSITAVVIQRSIDHGRTFFHFCCVWRFFQLSRENVSFNIQKETIFNSQCPRLILLKYCNNIPRVLSISRPT